MVHPTCFECLAIKAEAPIRSSASDAGRELRGLAACGDAVGLRECLAGVSAVTATDANGNSVMHVAAENGHVATIRVLLEDGRASVDATNAKLQTPVYVAAAAGHQDATRVLAEEGLADLTMRDAAGRTAAQVARSRGFVRCAEALETAAPDGRLRRLFAREDARLQISLRRHGPIFGRPPLVLESDYAPDGLVDADAERRLNARVAATSVVGLAISSAHAKKPGLQQQHPNLQALRAQAAREQRRDRAAAESRQNATDLVDFLERNALPRDSSATTASVCGFDDDDDEEVHGRRLSAAPQPWIQVCRRHLRRDALLTQKDPS